MKTLLLALALTFVGAAGQHRGPLLCAAQVSSPGALCPLLLRLDF
jgi:hypothetical protein